MSYLLIDQWDAVELFCRIILKVDKKVKLEDFQNNDFLLNELEKYSKGDAARKVSIKVFGKKLNDKNKAVPKRPKSFYELGRKIRNSIPIVLEKNELSTYITFLKDPNFKLHKTHLSSWLPSNKQRQLEGRQWILYYYHEQNEKDETNRTKRESGIAKALLTLNSFGKADLEGYKPSESYVGKFRMYGKEERHLLLEMKLKKAIEKDLHILVYIGTGYEIELAIGEFHNIGRTIYSGTVVIEAVNNQNGDLTPHFFKGNEITVLPDHVQKYFIDKRQNVLRVPIGIQSVSDFNEWHKQKNP